MSTAPLVNPADLLTSQEVADALGLTRQRISQMKHRGDLRPVVERTGVTLYLREDVEREAERRAA